LQCRNLEREQKASAELAPGLQLLEDLRQKIGLVFQQAFQFRRNAWRDDMSILTLNYKKRLAAKLGLFVRDGDVRKPRCCATSNRALRCI